MEVFKLGNGLKVLYSHEEGFPILAGALFTPLRCSCDEPEGITLLTLRTAVKGARSFSQEEFSRLQERSGSPFVAELSCDYSLVKFQCVSEKSTTYFNLLKETLKAPDFSEESFKVEKSSLLASIRSKKESSFTLAYEEVMRRTYRGAPYSKLPYGSLSSVEKLEVEDSKRWFEEKFLPEGSVLALCGRGDGLDRLLKSLEELPLKPFKGVSFSSKIAESSRVTVRREGSRQSFIMVALNAPSVRDENYELFKLLNTVIGEGIGSLLFQELREKRGLAYSTGSIYPTRLNDGRLLLYIGSSPEKELEAERELLKLVRELPELVDESSLQRAKEYFRGTYLLEHELRSKRAWYYGFWEVMGRGYPYDGELPERLSSYTLGQVKEAAERLSREPTFTVVVRDG